MEVRFGVRGAAGQGVVDGRLRERLDVAAFTALEVQEVTEVNELSDGGTVNEDDSVSTMLEVADEVIKGSKGAGVVGGGGAVLDAVTVVAAPLMVIMGAHGFDLRKRPVVAFPGLPTEGDINDDDDSGGGGGGGVGSGGGGESRPMTSEAVAAFLDSLADGASTDGAAGGGGGGGGEGGGGRVATLKVTWSAALQVRVISAL